MRPIDADSLKSVVNSRVYHNHNGIIKIIDEQPTINAVSSVHAHWIELRANGGNVHCKCSRCGKEVSYSYAKKRWKYCIECGARMDKEETVD